MKSQTFMFTKKARIILKCIFDCFIRNVKIDILQLDLALRCIRSQFLIKTKTNFKKLFHVCRLQELSFLKKEDTYSNMSYVPLEGASEEAKM